VAAGRHARLAAECTQVEAREVISATTAGVERPFRGLRYFDEADAHLFFGRDAQVDDLLRTLRRTRFVAVVGGSGSGKSSLVRAGLIPGLRAGFFVEAGGDWRVAVTRPGNAPVAGLASDLGEALKLDEVEVTLRRGPLGIPEAVRQASLPPDQHLLLVVDQFEELFRFQREAADRQEAADEAAFFVKLLLEASADTDLPIAVVMTMRSDFMGNCAQFRDLPERINDGLYLVPRMRRDQIQQAIVGPLGVVGASVTAPLVQRLLNDVGDDPDQLPVLQHVLLRTWQRWAIDESRGDALDLPHYERTGGFEHALSAHANEVFESLAPPREPAPDVVEAPPAAALSPRQRIAKALFARLVDRDAENRDVRRRATVDEIAAVAGVARDEVLTVVGAFAADGVWLLTRSGDLIDITHESLIRKWDRIRGTSSEKGWLAEEIEAKDALIELATRARRLATPACEALLAEWSRQGRVDPVREATRLAGVGGAFEDVLRGGELERALEARKMWAPWPWARRYLGDPAAFARTLLFIDASLEARAARERTEARARAEFEQARERQRRRAYVIAAGAVTLAVVFAVLAVLVWRFKRQADEEQSRAAQQAATLRTSTVVYGAAAALSRDPMVSALLLREVTPERAPWIALQVASDTVREGLAYAILRGHTGAVTDAAISSDAFRVATASQDGTARVWKADGTGESTVLRGHEGPVSSVAFNREGWRVVTASQDGTARIWSAAGGTEQAVLRGHQGPVMLAGFSADASRVFTLGEDGTARVWGPDGTALANLRAEGADARYAMWAISPDARQAALAVPDAPLRLFCVDGSCRPRTLGTTPSSMEWLRYSEDGRRLVLVSGASTSVWCPDGSCAPSRYETFSGARSQFALSEDGAFLAAGGETGEVSVWHLGADHQPAPARIPTGSRIGGPSWPHRTSLGRALAFSRSDAGGALLAVALANGTSTIWHIAQPAPRRSVGGYESPLRNPPVVRLVRSCRGHTGHVWGAAFDNVAGLMVTASGDGTARVWTAGSTGEPAVQRSLGSPVRHAVFSPNGEEVASGAEDGAVRLWAADEEWPSRTIDAAAAGRRQGAGFNTIAPVARVQFSPDGLQIAAAVGPEVRIWSTRTEAAPAIVLLPPVAYARVTALAYSPDGARVLTGCMDGRLELWSAADGRLIATLRGHKPEVTVASFDKSGARIVSAARERTPRLWTGDGRPLAILEGHEGDVLYATFSPDGSRILTASADRTARLWDVSGVSAPAVVGVSPAPHPQGTAGVRAVAAVRILAGHTDAVTKAVFNPAGDLVVTVSSDGTGRVWRVADGSEVAVLNGHFSAVVDVEFSPDGQRIVTASRDGTARLWQTDGAGEAMVLRGHRGPVHTVSFSPDGTRVLTASDDGDTRVWRVDLGGLLGLLRSGETSACLQREERQRFLRESREAAEAAYAACERRHGRMREAGDAGTRPPAR
jgi:WD40 repeat protein